jgi:predicted transport protein
MYLINVRDNPRSNQDGQSRDIGNIGHTRHRTDCRYLIKVKDNPWRNQDGQSRDIGNIGHTRHRTDNR